MSQELNRNFTVLKQKADPPPYFLSYEITEVEYHSVSGTLGTINATNGGKSRSLDVSVRSVPPSWTTTAACAMSAGSSLRAR